MSPIQEFIKREEINKLQQALSAVTEDQIKTLPVLYVNDLRRLARTINRVFGESFY